MKIPKLKITAFVVWLVATLMIVSTSLRGISKPDTATNLMSIAVLLFWICNSPNISVMSSKTALQTYVEHASPSLSHTKQ